MQAGNPSRTARAVAARRLWADRHPADYGDAEADRRLTADVAGDATPPPGPAAGGDDTIARYIRARTAFFDRAVVGAIGRGVTQMASVGAGYDGRALRYAHPAVTWFELDHPDTQADKRHRLARLGVDDGAVRYAPVDLATTGPAQPLLDLGFDPDASTLFCCEGVAVYLEPDAIGSLLAELRSLATVGSRLAVTWARSGGDDAGHRRLARAVEDAGEPFRNRIDRQAAAPLVEAARWRPVDLSERASAVGFAMLAPDWRPAGTGGPTRSRIGAYLDSTFGRSGEASLAEHLQRRYGIAVRDLRAMDVGVYRVERSDGDPWVARVFPAARPARTARQDAEILRWLEDEGVPAERLAHPDPLSTHFGQAVLVTAFLAGGPPPSQPGTFARLGDLLGRLHCLDPGPEGSLRPGGAWHHVCWSGGPAAEIDAVVGLLDAARPRLEAAAADTEALTGELAGWDRMEGLPVAFNHPDPVRQNAAAGPDGPVLFDWTGAGRGPRIAALGFLLWAAAGCRGGVRAAASAYAAHVTLEPAETDRLVAAVGLRPMVLDCWSVATGRAGAAEIAASRPEARRRCAQVADRASPILVGAYPGSG